VVQGIIELYGEERKFHGAARQSSLLKASIKMIHDLQLYGKVFERRFLDDSKKFFDALASDLAAKEDLASYVRTCDAVRTAELARCGFFDLDTRTRRDIVNIMDRWLVSNKVELLIKPEDIGGLLDDNDVESLEKIYALLERVGKHNQLRGAWEKYIRTNGAAIVSDEGRESEMVVRLLELKTRLDQVWRTSFHKHEELGHVLRESFASFINEKKKGSRGGSNSKPGEMIAKYVDMLLRGGIKAVPSAAAPSTGSKRLPSALISIGSGKEFGAEGEDIVMEDGDDEVQLNQQLDQVLDLFRFIEGKDVFEAFYKKDLARRLLMNRSASADAERTMLARLKTGMSLLHTAICNAADQVLQNAAPASLTTSSKCSKTSTWPATR
jgi:cullin-4